MSKTVIIAPKQIDMLRPAPKSVCCKSYWQKISPMFFALLLNRWLPLLSYLHSSVALWWHVHCRPSLQVKTPWSTCLTYGAQTLFAKDFYLSTDAQMRAKINNLGFFLKGSGLKSPLVPKRLCNPKTDACRRGDVGIERAKQKWLRS